MGVNSPMNAERLILDFLRYGTDAKVVTGAVVASALAGEVPRSTVYAALQRLVDAKHLVDVGTEARPKYRLVE